MGKYLVTSEAEIDTYLQVKECQSWLANHQKLRRHFSFFESTCYSFSISLLAFLFGSLVFSTFVCYPYSCWLLKGRYFSPPLPASDYDLLRQPLTSSSVQSWGLWLHRWFIAQGLLVKGTNRATILCLPGCVSWLKPTLL